MGQNNQYLFLHHEIMGLPPENFSGQYRKEPSGQYRKHVSYQDRKTVSGLYIGNKENHIREEDIREEEPHLIDDFSINEKIAKRLRPYIEAIAGMVGATPEQVNLYISERSSVNWEKPHGGRIVPISESNVRPDFEKMFTKGYLNIKPKQKASTITDPGF